MNKYKKRLMKASKRMSADQHKKGIRIADAIVQYAEKHGYTRKKVAKLIEKGKLLVFYDKAVLFDHLYAKDQNDEDKAQMLQDIAENRAQNDFDKGGILMDILIKNHENIEQIDTIYFLKE